MAKCLEKKRQVKLAQAAKFDRLARCAGGLPKRNTCLFHAKRFRNQAAAIAQQLAFKAASK
jgi:hypothetical protein